MSFEAISQLITAELVADLKTHPPLGNAWESIDPVERAQIIERWRDLILTVCIADAHVVIERYLCQGLGSKQAVDAAGEKVRALIAKESG